jgi:hypothetical protein
MNRNGILQLRSEPNRLIQLTQENNTTVRRFVQDLVASLLREFKRKLIDIVVARHTLES